MSERSSNKGSYREAGWVGRLLAGRALRRVGFWATVVLPFAALGILAVQPRGWLSLLGAVFLVNGLAVVVGHCYGREC